MPRYNPATIEPKWQRYWEENRTFATPRLPPPDKQKLFVLDMFPYPSGDGLHVGHPEGYTATDIVARTCRMRGMCVMHPMGFDAFGLPAEEHAIKTGTHPRVQTESNIVNFRRQLKMLGFSYDWQREIATTDVDYFRWTQWIFLQIFDTWFDAHQQRGRPIDQLPIPAAVTAEGPEAVARYRDAHRLAYQTEAPVNWCPALGTVLANEEVTGGMSERGGHPVVRIPLRQWMLRITAYADRLEKDLDNLDWPESVKILQRNWIGRSEGAEVDFYIGKHSQRDQGRPSDAAWAAWRAQRSRDGFPDNPGDEVLRVFTTRPDTLFGATYMVVAPEHPLVEALTTDDRRNAVQRYCQQASMKSDLDRTDLAKEKTGEFTGSYAINPVNARAVPIWVADYVLVSYGTGAIMAVPAHDERDFEFAQQFGMDIVAVVDPRDHVPADSRAKILAGKQVYISDGVAVQSERYDGMSTERFQRAVAEDLAREGLGAAAVNYKLRDWLFSRQRFWGEPFPIVHMIDGDGKPTGVVAAVPEEQLPIDLPELEDFRPHGRPEPPLEKAPHEWLYPSWNGQRAKRETNTMPQWAGSCWYYLRFLDPHNEQMAVDPDIEKAWMPVDLYVGGAEHAVLHLLYARFWHKVLYDRGVVSTPEPFRKLVNQGMILGEIEFTGFQRRDGTWISASDVAEDATGETVARGSGEPVQAVRLDQSHVEKHQDRFVLRTDSAIRVDSRAYKMSKSRGNVVNPDEVVKEYGADALRLYEMFMGPLEAPKPWSMEGVRGVRNFLDRVWRMIADERAEHPRLNDAVTDTSPTEDQNRMLHRTIKQVTRDVDKLQFNTAIARMMEFTNFFMKQPRRPRHAMQSFVLLLSPFAPHICEELWQLLGNPQSLALHPWPRVDESAIREETIQVVVQVNGKMRNVISVAADADAEHVQHAARSDKRVGDSLKGKTVKKVVLVPGKLVNFVVE